MTEEKSTREAVPENLSSTKALRGWTAACLTAVATIAVGWSGFTVSWMSFFIRRHLVRAANAGGPRSVRPADYSATEIMGISLAIGAICAAVFLWFLPVLATLTANRAEKRAS